MMVRSKCLFTISLCIMTSLIHVAFCAPSTGEWSGVRSRDTKEQYRRRRHLEPRKELVSTSSNFSISGVQGFNEEITIDDALKTYHIDFTFTHAFNHGHFTPSGWMYFKRDLRKKAKGKQLDAGAKDHDPIPVFQYRAKEKVVGARPYFIMVKSEKGDTNPSPTWEELNIIIDFLSKYQEEYNSRFREHMGDKIPGADFELFRLGHGEGEKERLRIAEGWFEKKGNSVDVETF